MSHEVNDRLADSWIDRRDEVKKMTHSLRLELATFIAMSRLLDVPYDFLVTADSKAMQIQKLLEDLK